MSEEIDYIEEVCRLEKTKLAGTGLDGHLNGILAMLPYLRSQLTAALAEREEARERVKVLESSLRIAETVRKAGNKALAAQLDTEWQQRAEAFREAAANVCYERAQNQGSNQCRYAGDDIFALPVPERKEG